MNQASRVVNTVAVVFSLATTLLAFHGWRETWSLLGREPQRTGMIAYLTRLIRFFWVLLIFNLAWNAIDILGLWP